MERTIGVVAYRELALPDHPFLACVWTADAPESAAERRVLPDACVDVVWVDDRLVVAGPATGPVLAQVGGRASAGVRFRVGAAGEALGLPGARAARRDRPDRGRLGRRRAAARGARGRGARSRSGAGRRRRRAAAARAARSGGPRRRGRARRSAGARGAARRRRRRAPPAPPLRRRGRVRARRRSSASCASSASSSSRAPDADLAWLALDAGYADQAHLTRECGRLSGLTPAALLASGATPAGEPVSDAGPFRSRRPRDDASMAHDRTSTPPPSSSTRPRACWSASASPTWSTAPAEPVLRRRCAPTATTTAASATRSSRTCAGRTASRSASTPRSRSCTRSATPTTRCRGLRLPRRHRVRGRRRPVRAPERARPPARALVPAVGDVVAHADRRQRRRRCRASASTTRS